MEQEEVKKGRLWGKSVWVVGTFKLTQEIIYSTGSISIPWWVASSSLLFVVAARTSEAIYSGGRCQFFLFLLGACAPILVYCCYYNNNNIELTMVAYLQLNKYCVTFAFSVL